MTVRPNASVDVVRRNIEAVQNGGDFAVFDEIFADDFTDHTPQQGVPADKDGVRALYTGLRTAFPDFHAEIHWQAVEDDKVTTFKTYHGTHRGEFLGVPGTGLPVQFDTIDVFRVRDGRLTDHWGIADLLTVLIQLGRLSADTAL
ncbi:ester cyclase [Mycobacterium yunnanensis]|uniref:Ester cyclase n=1 Tax=Mycobacterium yunnanensis TaxID=368477 RepID=A0A9X3C2L1_9MYCO|nr:ester cyclase [Mycobacterium yunnanensis]MCV7420517.1 ester cyclase [Mycobacterium yunnanensis]